MTFNVTVLKLFIGCENLRENTKTLCIEACRNGQSDLLKFNPSIKMGKKADFK